MDVNEMFEYCKKLMEQGKGSYKIQAQNIDYNTANGGSYRIDENVSVSGSEIKVDDENKTVTIGDYNEYYS